MKKLIEKKNSLIAQAEELLAACETEVRGLTDEENEKYIALKAEIEDLNNEIKATEERAKEGAVVEVVENNDLKGEERSMEMNKELEVRGVEQYLRKTDGEEVRAMTYGANGHLVPEYLHGELVKTLPEVAPLFAEVPKLTPVAGTLRVAREKQLGEAGFVGEDEELTLADVKTDFVELTQKRAGAAIELSQKLINDAGIDVVAYSQELLFRRLGYALDRAMVTGDGTKSIEGLVNAPETCKVELGVPGTLTIDDMMKMAANMKTVYQTGAKWVMDRAAFEKLAAMKDGNGHFYVVRAQEVDGTIAYKLFGLTILINDAAKGKIFLANFAHAFKGMVKKEVGLKTIDGDRHNALKGTVTLVLDAYVDVKIVQPEAIRFVELA
ncbi:MAG TPA: phage major capsid protein [Lachnospiraceae bacterium]|nr:phage major capsid protein [uncultured Lachnoclostridium sp.]HAU85078.1 phage major capsid protein [Lachnospiraceae bacterium]